MKWKENEQKELSNLFNIKNGEDIAKMYLKSDVILLTCVFRIFIKSLIKEFDIIDIKYIVIVCHFKLGNV